MRALQRLSIRQRKTLALLLFVALTATAWLLTRPAPASAAGFPVPVSCSTSGVLAVRATIDQALIGPSHIQDREIGSIPLDYTLTVGIPRTVQGTIDSVVASVPLPDEA